jgi:hypothetical protein
MTPKQAVTFVKGKGVVLESARGPVPSLAEAIAGEPIRGSWWAHPEGNDIFLCSRAIRKSADVLVCRLVNGKVTYVHRRLWPALVRLAQRFDADRLAAIREVHTASGKHKVDITRFPDWVPEEVLRAAEELSSEEAAALLALVPLANRTGTKVSPHDWAAPAKRPSTRPWKS